MPPLHPLAENPPEPRRVWADATRRIRRQFTAWLGQPITLTGPHIDGLRPRTGWIAAVSAHGFVFAWQPPGAWGQEEPTVARTFVSWTDLWVQKGRTQVAGTMASPAAADPEAVDAADWVSAWIAETAGRLPLLGHPPSDATRKGAIADDRLSTRAHAGGSGGADRPAGGADAAGLPVDWPVPVP